ncbi:hypothetical protein J4E91_010783 [Alternaria rosae]|nr:hypothetical protein J4E91_010783 [Alternaria rosae]
MFTLCVTNRVRFGVLNSIHPIPRGILRLKSDEDLIMAFHILLEEIESWPSSMRLVKTLQNIIEVVFEMHGGWAYLQLGQHQQSFLQQMSLQHSFNLPQQKFFINQQIPPPAMIGQALTQNIVVHSHTAPAPAQIQGSSNQDKNELFLDRLNKDNDHNEKMKHRYDDELAVKARARLEAEEKKAIETEKEEARKLKEAQKRFERIKIENDLKEDTILRTDEALSRGDEMKRKTREMMERAEQEKLDAERKFAEQRREAAAKREQDRRNQERQDQQRREQDRQSHFNEEVKQPHDYRQRMLSENERSQQFSPTPQNQLVPDNDDDDPDSDEEKRKDPYELIGLPDRGRTPVKDIETTQRVLNRIHQKTLDTAMSDSKRIHAEKRMVEIKWAADILLNEMNKRAFDEAGAIHPHEQQAWRKKSK